MRTATTVCRCAAVLVLCTVTLAVDADGVVSDVTGVAVDGNRIALCADIYRHHYRTTLGTLLTGEMDGQIVARETAVAMYAMDKGVARLLWRRSLPHCYRPLDGYMLVDGDQVEFVSPIGTRPVGVHGGAYRVRVGRTTLQEQLAYTDTRTACYVSSTLDVFARAGVGLIWLPHGSNAWLKTALPIDITSKTGHDPPTNALLIPSFVRGHLALCNEAQAKVTLHSISGDTKSVHLPKPFKAAAVVGTRQSQWVLVFECMSREAWHECDSRHRGLSRCATNVNLVAFADGRLSEMSEEQRTWIDTIKRRTELLRQGGVVRGRKLTMTVTVSNEEDPETKIKLVIPPPKRIAVADDVIVLPSLWPPHIAGTSGVVSESRQAKPIKVEHIEGKR